MTVSATSVSFDVIGGKEVTTLATKLFKRGDPTRISVSYWDERNSKQGFEAVVREVRRENSVIHVILEESMGTHSTRSWHISYYEKYSNAKLRLGGEFSYSI